VKGRGPLAAAGRPADELERGVSAAKASSRSTIAGAWCTVRRIDVDLHPSTVTGKPIVIMT